MSKLSDDLFNGLAGPHGGEAEIPVDAPDLRLICETTAALYKELKRQRKRQGKRERLYGKRMASEGRAYRQLSGTDLNKVYSNGHVPS